MIRPRQQSSPATLFITACAALGNTSNYICTGIAFVSNDELEERVDFVSACSDAMTNALGVGCYRDYTLSFRKIMYSP